MDVVEEIKPQMEGEIAITHNDEVELRTPTSERKAEQNGAQMMVNNVGSPLVQKEVKPSLSTPKENGEVSLGIEKKALPILDPQEDEFGVVKPGSNMRLESEIDAMEEGEADYVQIVQLPRMSVANGADNIQTAPSDAEDRTEGEETKFAECSWTERKFSSSEEASVDVHLEDSEKRDTTEDSLKTVSIVDHALLFQENSEEFAGVAQELETEPTLAAKWSYEVSVDVFMQDECVEVEMHSVAEPEASTAGIASGFATEKPSPSGLVCVEPVNRNLNTEHEAQSAIGVIEFEKQEAPQVFEKRTETIQVEKQGRELISQSLGIEESITGTERDMASQGAFERKKSLNLPEQPLSDSIEWESNHSNERETTSQGLQAFPTQVRGDPKNAVPISTQYEDIDLRVCLSSTSGQADESMGCEFVPAQVETNNVAESTPCTSESPVLADVELTCERTTHIDSNQGERHVKSTARVPSFADWERGTEVEVRTTDIIVAEPKEELLESSSSPPKQSESVDGSKANIKEQIQRIWSLKYLKTRPVMVEPRALTEQAIRPVKPKVPKVVGLPWPPTPLLAAEDEHYVDTDDAFTSPRQRVADSVGATDTIVAEPKEELLEPTSSPSKQSDGNDGAEANTREQMQRLWSLKYLKTKPVRVEPRTVTEGAVRPVKPKAPKVVGLCWPPAPLVTAKDIDVAGTFRMNVSGLIPHLEIR